MDFRLPGTRKISQQTRSSLARLNHVGQTQKAISEHAKERRARWVDEVKKAEEALERQGER